MRNQDGVVLEGLSRLQAERVHLLLASMQLNATVIGGGGRRFAILVADADRDRAIEVLADEYPDGVPQFTRTRIRRSSTPADFRWFGQGSWMVVALLATCVGIHLLVHTGFGPSPRSRMMGAGAIAGYLVDRGEIWRLASAVFLHFDAGHLLSNMGTLTVLGPPLARLVGAWRLFGLFLATGVLANVVSHALNPIAGLKAGASGGIAGLLGALAGQALRPDRDRRLRPWIAVGALGAFYAMMIGFGPGRDNHAHVAGVVFGLILGRYCPSLPEPAEPQSESESEATSEPALPTEPNGPPKGGGIVPPLTPDIPTNRTLH
ncbi:MAG: membrane associated rhomboid family serine protease [Hyphomicrobiaceae bacterium]|jgi:membrane associated rhomboid family serine protease